MAPYATFRVPALFLQKTTIQQWAMIFNPLHAFDGQQNARCCAMGKPWSRIKILRCRWGCYSVCILKNTYLPCSFMLVSNRSFTHMAFNEMGSIEDGVRVIFWFAWLFSKLTQCGIALFDSHIISCSMLFRWYCMHFLCLKLRAKYAQYLLFPYHSM